MHMRGQAAIYCRISDDREGLEKGVARQEKDCRELAKKLGLDVAAVFIDNDRGASTRSRKARPEYAAMLRRARNGEFAHVIAYSNSRLTRRLSEFEDLIALHEQTGVQIRTCVSGQDDLSTADGRMVARIKASVDAAEAERTGERVARVHLANAESGVPVGGTRPFGYEKDGITVRESEAIAIQDAAARLVKGESLHAIVREWNAAGMRTSKGNPWVTATLRQMLQRPRIVGWRVHRGEVLMRDGKPVLGQWPAIIDEDTYRALAGRFAAASTKGQRLGGRKYLLSGIIRCQCGQRLRGNGDKAKGTFYYVCPPPSQGGCGKVGVSGPKSDAKVVAEFRERWGGLTFKRTSVPFPQAQELADKVKRVAELMQAFTAGSLSAEATFPAVEALEGEIRVLRTAERAWTAEDHGPQEFNPATDQFDSWPVDRQRDHLAHFLHSVVVSPAKSRGGAFDPERVKPVWKE